MGSLAVRAVLEMSLRSTSRKLSNERGPSTGADHQVDDVQSIEQSLREPARGDSIAERHCGP
jgi:hypothetical protein